MKRDPHRQLERGKSRLVAAEKSLLRLARKVSALGRRGVLMDPGFLADYDLKLRMAAFRLGAADEAVERAQVRVMRIRGGA